MFQTLFLVSALFVAATFAADCISSNGAKCLKKSEMPAGFGPMMLGGDPCFSYNGNRVRSKLLN